MRKALPHTAKLLRYGSGLKDRFRTWFWLESEQRKVAF
jgi:hypothetical protein